MKFDKLNILKDEDYFEPMAISVDDKNRRRELADLLTDVFLYFFSVYEVHRAYNSMLERALYEQLLNDKISDAVSQVTGIDGEMSNHIRALSKEVVDTTIRHADKENTDTDTQVGQNSANSLNERHTHTDSNSNFFTAPRSEESLDSPYKTSDSHITGENEEDEPLNKEDDEVEEMMENEAVMNYWLSIHRAVNIAQNEANTFLNYSDFVDAKARGYTKKTWLTMLDNKVRDSHDEIEGETIGIDDFFQVGNSELRFPHDWMMSPDPKETVNCRCAIDYGK